jgi:hypothetical protein
MPGRAVDSRGAGGLAEDPTGHTELLAEQAGVAIPHILQARRYTQESFAKVKRVLDGEDIPDSVSVCVFGSWARHELTAGSDHDWALLTAQPTDDKDPEIAGAMRAAKRHLGGKDHGPGSQEIFGVPFDVHTLAHNVGLEDDTNKNLTRRMMLLLESAALTGSIHAPGWKAVLDRYMNEGVKDFWPPRFLLNDLIRYWRTVCVDFEGKHRDTHDTDPKWVPRNAKLKTSRKLLFAGGLIPILLCHRYEKEQMKAFLARWLPAPPLDRLSAAFRWAQAEAEGARALDAYDRWIAIQQDSQARATLKTLTRQTREDSDLFRDIKAIAEQFERALLTLLLDSRLRQLSRELILF